ncbi:MAG: hypothetical protein AAF447_07525, partial [Myxococcota bacterium]
MSFRARLTLFFLLAALGPLAAFGALVRTTLVRQLEADHARLLESWVTAATWRLEERRVRDRAAAQAHCDHDAFLQRTLGQLSQGSFGDAEERRLAGELPALMRSRGFDTLHVIDASEGARHGRILGTGHYPDLVGGADPGLLDALVRAGEAPFVARLRLRGARDARVLVTGCVLSRAQPPASVAVLVGRRLGDAFAEELCGDGDPEHVARGRPGAELPAPLHGSPAPREGGASAGAP